MAIQRGEHKTGVAIRKRCVKEREEDRKERGRREGRHEGGGRGR